MTIIRVLLLSLCCSTGFAVNTYTFVDLFETVPNVGDGYADGHSINGVNGWVCDYRGIDGVWH